MTDRNDPAGRPALIAELIDRLARLVRAQAHDSALNPAQWDALRYLESCNRFSNTPGALARYLAATKGTVSQTLNALERKGLIARADDPQSGRVVRLSLTRAGRAALARDPLLLLTRSAQTLPPPAAGAVADGLLDMLSALQRANNHRPFGVCGTCRHFRRDAAGGDPHFCALLHERLSARDAEQICGEHEPLAA